MLIRVLALAIVVAYIIVFVRYHQKCTSDMKLAYETCETRPSQICVTNALIMYEDRSALENVNARVLVSKRAWMARTPTLIGCQSLNDPGRTVYVFPPESRRVKHVDLKNPTIDLSSLTYVAIDIEPHQSLLIPRGWCVAIEPGNHENGTMNDQLMTLELYTWFYNILGQSLE